MEEKVQKELSGLVPLVDVTNNRHASGDSTASSSSTFRRFQFKTDIKVNEAKELSTLKNTAWCNNWALNK